MSVLLMGRRDDPHLQALQDCLENDHGARVDTFDTSLLIKDAALTWSPSSQIGTLRNADGSLMNLADIGVGFWRSLDPVMVSPALDDQKAQVAWQDGQSLLASFLRESPFPWVNGWLAYDLHRVKPVQLRIARETGYRIPETLVTGDAEAGFEFAKRAGALISKPVWCGGYARLTKGEDLERDRITELLKEGPRTLQEFVPGTSIRTYVIGEETFSVEIESDMVDFREDPHHKVTDTALPAEIEKNLAVLMERLHLHWTAIDWRKTPLGEYYFLEANFSPMFLGIEARTGYSITAALSGLIMRLPPRPGSC